MLRKNEETQIEENLHAEMLRKKEEAQQTFEGKFHVKMLRKNEEAQDFLKEISMSRCCKRRFPYHGSASGAPGSGGMVETPSAELATARCRATDSTLHQRRAQPWAAAARKGVVGRVGHGTKVGYGGTASTRCSSGAPLLQRGLLVVEALRGQLRVARDFAAARRDKRDSIGCERPRQDRKQHAFSKESVKCENGVSLPTWVSRPSSPSAAGASARPRETPTPVCSSSTPQQAGVQPPQLHVGKALPVRPRALALAELLRRGIVSGIVGATP